MEILKFNIVWRGGKQIFKKIFWKDRRRIWIETGNQKVGVIVGV